MTLPELESFFESVELPESIQLDECTNVVDVKKCIESGLRCLKAHTGNKCYLPYYKQLIELKTKIEEP